MPLTQWRVPVPGGHLAGLGNEAAGPDVLFVHSHGFSSMTWARLIERLPGFRCVAMDLRGHGDSRAPLLDAAEYWRDIPLLIEALDLDRPVIVGHNSGAFAALAAAADRPGLASAIVSLDADLPFVPRASLQAELDLAQSPEMAEAIRGRFRFGATMSTEAEREEFVAAQLRRCLSDWLLTGVDDAIEAEIRQSIVPRPDGTWIHLPTLEAALIGYRISLDATYYPTAELYELVDDPVHLVRCLRGPNLRPDVDAYVELLARRPNMTLHDMDAGHLAHYSHADEVAAVVRLAASSSP